MENKVNNKKNKFIILAFIIILIIQILTIIYAASKRQWLHMDELTSYGLIQYHNPFLFKNKDYFNTWNDSEYFKDYLILNSDEKWNWNPIYTNQAEDVHPPLYYLLLRMACSFNINSFSIWPGTILNIILYVLSSIIIYKIGLKVFDDEKYSLLLVSLNGFSIVAIQTVLFIRMYQLLNLNVLLLVYWNLYKIKEKELNKKILIPLYFMVLSGFLTHYYYLIFLFIMYSLLTIYFLIKKNYLKWIKYTFTLFLSGITGLCIFPYCINHFFYTNRGTDVITSINQSLQISLLKFHRFFSIINDKIFYGYILIVIIVCFIVLSLIVLIKKKDILNNKSDRNNINGIFFISIAYFIIVAYISPFIDIRYMYPIVPLIFCITLYYFKELLSYILKDKITFIILLIFVMIFSIIGISKLSNNSYTFKGYNNVISYIKETTSNLPILMFYSEENATDNKIMDIFFTFLNSNKTYILSNTDANSEKILDIIDDVDLSNGLLLITYYNESEDKLNKVLETKLFNEYRYLLRISVFHLIILK